MLPKKLTFSKEKKSLLKKHLEYLTLFFLLVSSLLLLVFILDYKQIIYPSLHRYQLSPKQYVEKRVALFPPGVQKVEVLEHGLRDKKVIALTFDADMTPAMLVLLKKGLVKSWYNRQIKDILDKEGVKATIFLGGLWTKTYSKEALDLANDPLIELGNHSYNHYAFRKGCYQLGNVDDDLDKDDVSQAQKIIVTTTGKTPKYFRFPGGCYEKIDVETIARLGLKIVHWDVVARDGFNSSTDSIANKVLSSVQNGSIVVFHIHDGPYAPKTAEALKKIIPDLKKQGYQFVTISEMIENR